MKNLIIIIAAIVVLASCGKEYVVEGTNGFRERMGARDQVEYSKGDTVLYVSGYRAQIRGIWKGGNPPAAYYSKGVVIEVKE